jgi:hypothetical protein
MMKEIITKQIVRPKTGEIFQALYLGGDAERIGTIGLAQKLYQIAIDLDEKSCPTDELLLNNLPRAYAPRLCPAPMPRAYAPRLCPAPMLRVKKLAAGFINFDEIQRKANQWDVQNAPPRAYGRLGNAP